MKIVACLALLTILVAFVKCNSTEPTEATTEANNLGSSTVTPNPMTKTSAITSKTTNAKSSMKPPTTPNSASSLLFNGVTLIGAIVTLRLL